MIQRALTIGISIHAPTRGATTGLLDIEWGNGHFNPRSHERSDRVWLGRIYIMVNFNPRSHERSDEKPQTAQKDTNNFNPRSHERSDKIELVDDEIPEDFNPRSHERSDQKKG